MALEENKNALPVNMTHIIFIFVYFADKNKGLQKGGNRYVV